MESNFYKSNTWKKNAINSKNFKAVGIHNFHNFKTISGLYEYPSPFIYNKSIQPSNFGKLRVFFQKIFKFQKINTLKKKLKNLYDKLPSDIKIFLPESKHEHGSFLSLTHKRKKYKVNGVYIKCAEQAYNLKKSVKNLLNLSILEIGGGYGVMAEIMMGLGIKNYFICDLDETLDLAELYLKNFTDYDIIRINSHKDFNKLKLYSSFGTIFLCDVKNYLSLDKNIKFDIVINSCSFCEMNKEMLDKYLDIISKYSNAVISCSNKNRTEGDHKYSHDFWKNDKRFNLEKIYEFNDKNYESKNINIPQYIIRTKY
tara:strand:+ start:98 stop:1036 length:939 start_codon:yes stop_codon:yes gene_type:complete